MSLLGDLIDHLVPDPRHPFKAIIEDQRRNPALHLKYGTAIATAFGGPWWGLAANAQIRLVTNDQMTGRNRRHKGHPILHDQPDLVMPDSSQPVVSFRGAAAYYPIAADFTRPPARRRRRKRKRYGRMGR